MSRRSDAIPSPSMLHSSIPPPTPPHVYALPQTPMAFTVSFHIAFGVALNSGLYLIYLVAMVMVSLDSTAPGLPFSNPYFDPTRLSLDVIQPNFDRSIEGKRDRTSS